jgi:integrase
MASLSCRKNGGFVVKFYDNRVSRTLYLGRIRKRVGEEICRHVERLVEAKQAGVSMAPETASWVGTVDDRLRSKLERLGLIAERDTARVMRLDTFLKDYVSLKKGDVKKITIRNLDQTSKKLLDFFAGSRQLSSITVEDMRGFREWLANTKGFKPNTVKTHCRKAKQFFADAVDRGLIDQTPCRKLIGLQDSRNRDRERFMDLADTAKVLETCPTLEWKAIFVLARFGGLRPSEILNLEWTHIDWKRSVVSVPGAKARLGSGSRTRQMPLFPEVFTALNNLRNARPSGSGRIVLCYSPGDNLAVPMMRTIKGAGVEWERAFQNLRSTRSTELANMGIGIQDFCRWLGHSPKIALEHYLQIDARKDAQAASSLKTMP